MVRLLKFNHLAVILAMERVIKVVRCCGGDETNKGRKRKKNV
jgi:hypothetical protein